MAQLVEARQRELCRRRCDTERQRRTLAESGPWKIKKALGVSYRDAHTVRCRLCAPCAGAGRQRWSRWPVARCCSRSRPATSPRPPRVAPPPLCSSLSPRTREGGARGADTWQKGDLSVTPHISLDSPQNWTRSYTLSCRVVLGHGLSLLTAAPPQTGPRSGTRHVSTSA